MTAINLDSVRSSLTEARTRLVRQLGELGSEETGELRSDVVFGDGFADAAAATAERTEVLGLVDNLKKQLDEVDGALARIDSGEYGKCSNCGREISAARLEARPEATLCIDCKSKLAS
jgi:RNA polymerase-binding protein DksA